ncbi:hypothetical protein Tco_0399923 [Tanacetum coccineum]
MYTVKCSVDIHRGDLLWSLGFLDRSCTKEDISSDRSVIKEGLEAHVTVKPIHRRIPWDVFLIKPPHDTGSHRGINLEKLVLPTLNRKSDGKIKAEEKVDSEKTTMSTTTNFKMTEPRSPKNCQLGDMYPKKRATNSRHELSRILTEMLTLALSTGLAFEVTYTRSDNEVDIKEETLFTTVQFLEL